MMEEKIMVDPAVKRDLCALAEELDVTESETISRLINIRKAVLRYMKDARDTRRGLADATTH